VFLSDLNCSLTHSGLFPIIKKSLLKNCHVWLSSTVVEEHAAEPVAAEEGDAGGQASTAAQMCTLPGVGQFQALPPSQCKIDLGKNQCPRFLCFLTGKVSFSGKAWELLVITQGAISSANGSHALPEKDTFPVRKAPQWKPLRGNFEGAEGPGIAPHPAACAFAPL
jgi:hypothetical protein